MNCNEWMPYLHVTVGAFNVVKCGFTAKLQEREERAKLYQFLVRINENYETVRGQILATEPLPTVNKAFYIVHQLEIQKEITCFPGEPAAFFSNNQNVATNK